MHKKLLVGVSVIGAALIFISGGLALAASDTYKFTVRGNVTAVDRTAKTLTVYTTHASGKASDDLAGNTIEFNTVGARIFKTVSGKKARVTLGGVPVGNEVVMTGAKRSNGQFNVSEITVNNNAFNVVGTLRGHNTTDKILTVDISYTDYKSSTFLDKRVLFSYGSNTKFYNYKNAEINADEVTNNDEKIKITGTVDNGNKWEAAKVIDGYTKAK